MIKTNDLRIGNWVFYKGDSDNRRIIGIQPRRINIDVDGKNYSIPLAAINGIELSPIILIGCKFHKLEPNIYSFFKRYFYDIEKGIMKIIGDDDKGYIKINMNYLHELQNLINFIGGVDIEVIFLPTS